MKIDTYLDELRVNAISWSFMNAGYNGWQLNETTAGGYDGWWFEIWHEGWSNVDMDEDPGSDLQESRVW